jgi:sugar transferase (PEP-CTERM system associated)
MPAWSINRTIRTPLLLLGAGELLVLYSSVYVAAIISCGSVALCEEKFGPLAWRASIFATIMLLSLVSTGLYHFHQRIYYHEALVRVLVGFALGSIALTAVFYALQWAEVMKTLGVIALAYSFALLLGLRYIFLRRADENAFRFRTIIYGAGSRASAIYDLRRKADRRGFKIVGIVPAHGDSQVIRVSDQHVVGEDIESLVKELNADEVVIAMDDRRGNLPVRSLLNCRLAGVQVIDLIEFLERESGKIRIDLVSPGWLIFSSGFRISKLRRATKRLVDLFMGASIAVVSLPVMALITLAIKIEDGLSAPVLYRQVRVGYRGRNFSVLKFRSMREDAEADGEAVWAEVNDSRITRVGNVLRKLRLDELPQVFNVVRGEMSIVGPRPERPEFVSELAEAIPYYAERHAVLPGVTGWAQINYPYGSTERDAAEKLQYDLYYVKNHNVFLDLMIILQTVEVVLWGKGSR